MRHAARAQGGRYMDSIDPILDAGMYPLVIKHGNGKSLFIYIYIHI